MAGSTWAIAVGHGVNPHQRFRKALGDTRVVIMAPPIPIPGVRRRRTSARSQVVLTGLHFLPRPGGTWRAGPELVHAKTLDPGRHRCFINTPSTDAGLDPRLIVNKCDGSGHLVSAELPL